MDMLTTLTPYHWLALGLLLLTAEMLGAAGFLIGAAVAALGMGVAMWFFPDLANGTQFALYAVAAIVSTGLYFKVFRDASAPPRRATLNKATQRLLGHTFTLDRDVAHGASKVQIGDTLWKVHASEPLNKGDVVEVVEARRASLVIAAIRTSAAVST